MALTKVIGAGLGAVTESSSLSYGNSQASIVVQDDTNPNIVINDTGQSKDYFITALGSQLSIRYADGGGSGSASNVTQLMSMDNSGAITKPNQPAFWVRPSSTQSNIAADGSTVTIVWGTETYDQNADFSSNTFTAPVTGKYFMHARVTLQSIDSAASYYQFNIATSNAAHSFIFDPRGMDQDTNHYPFELTAVADMDVNDTATVTILQPNGTAQTDILHTSSWTSWYGYLLG